MSEQDLVNQIIAFLNLEGHVATRINSGMQIIPGNQRRVFRGAPAGTADIIACIHGKYVAIECKLKSNKPTLPQQAYLKMVQDAGGIAIVAYSLDDVINAIAQNF